MAPLAVVSLSCSCSEVSGESISNILDELRKAQSLFDVYEPVKSGVLLIAFKSAHAAGSFFEDANLHKVLRASGALAPFSWDARAAFASTPKPAVHAVNDDVFAEQAKDACTFAHYEQALALDHALRKNKTVADLLAEGRVQLTHLHDARTAADVLRLLTAGSGIQSGKNERAALDATCNYFGPRIALYFAFLRHYTRFLILPAAVGLVQVVAGRNTGNTEDVGAIVVALVVINVVWACAFTRCLPRHLHLLLSRWGYNAHARKLLDQTTVIATGEVSMRLNHVGELELSIRMALAWMAIALSLVLVVAPVAFLFFSLVYASSTGEMGRFYRIIVGLDDTPRGVSPYAFVARRLYETSWLGMHRDDRFEDASCVLSAGGACYLNVSDAALLIIVQLQAQAVVQLNNFGARLAHSVSKFEMHRSESDLAEARVIKSIAFYLLNAFAGPFYYAFVLRDFELLRKYLAARLLTAQITGTIMEVVMPYIMYKIERFKARSSRIERTDTIKAGQLGYTSTEAAMAAVHSLRPSHYQQMQPEYLSSAVPDSREGGDFDDLLEIMLQYANSVLFFPIYPMAAVLAFANNVVEVRSDGFRLCRLLRYPLHVQRGPQGIAAWVTSFQVVSWLSVLINCGLLLVHVAETSERKGSTASLLAPVGLEHALGAACLAICAMVPTTPEAVERLDLVRERMGAHSDTSWLSHTSFGRVISDGYSSPRSASPASSSDITKKTL